jgi:general secretion pathway protein B
MDAPVYAPEIPVAGTPVAGTPAVEPAAPPQYPSGAYNTAAPSPKPDPRLARALYPPPPPDEVLPTLNEINLSGNRGIPELHMDIHVYAAKPSERFVFFNNRKYREGETLQEGPSVERITREGVVLRFQGLRFTVPRQ